MIIKCNNDIKHECILGWFWNDNISEWRVFGMLTAIKADGSYEEHWGKRWKYFRPATKDEVLERCVQGDL